MARSACSGVVFRSSAGLMMPWADTVGSGSEPLPILRMCAYAPMRKRRGPCTVSPPANLADCRRGPYLAEFAVTACITASRVASVVTEGAEHSVDYELASWWRTGGCDDDESGDAVLKQVKEPL